MGIWTAAVAWYIAFAELLNEVWFRGRVSQRYALCALFNYAVAQL